MNLEIYLKIYYEGPYQKLSKLMKKKFYTYCNNFYDLIMYNGKLTSEAITFLETHLHMKNELQDYSENESFVRYIIIDCDCGKNFSKLTAIIQKNYGIEISPVRFEDGWEYHKFVCINPQIASKILEVLNNNFKIELIYSRENKYHGPLKFLGVSIKEFIDNLTSAQMSVLLEAYHNGYYNIPRTIKLADIAEKQDKTRYAIESRLRRGENTIMDLVLPLLDHDFELAIGKNDTFCD